MFFFNSIQSSNGLPVTLLNTMKHSGRAWSEGCKRTIFEIITLWSINYRIFYVNTDQNGAFTAFSSIQSLNGLTLLNTVNQPLKKRTLVNEYSYDSILHAWARFLKGCFDFKHTR